MMRKFRIVRNKNDDRSIAEQTQEQCERLKDIMKVLKVSYDHNYIILEGYYL